MAEATSTALHPLLDTRWSPTSFDPDEVLTDAEGTSLLEAARWAPSAGNSQPWAFIVARRGDDDHRRLVPHLARSAAPWAATAGLLVANLAHRFVEDTDWDYSEFSAYDLGQAVAHMCFQAAALGLHVRQFRAFDRDAIAAEFGVPGHWEVTTMSAVGRAAGSPGATRSRKAAAELRWPSAPAAIRE
jgi:nitroreductase